MTTTPAPLPGAVPVTPAEMIDLLGGALDNARRDLESVKLQRDLATDQRNDARRLVEEARIEAAALLYMERQHSGHGRDGHLNEDDLKPLLTALQIDTEVQP